MNDLVEFLKARLDQDEAVARAATPGPWRADLSPVTVMSQEMQSPWAIQSEAEQYPHGRVAAPGYEGGGVRKKADADHIARHDPARVLRQVEAGRWVLARHKLDPDGRWASPGQELCAGCGCDWQGGIMPVDECPELRNLASIYQDASGWQERWHVS